MSAISFPDATGIIQSDQVAIKDTEHRVLVVAQKTSSGSATAGVVEEQVSSVGAPENALFGEDSMSADMVRGVKEYFPQGRCDVLPLADAGSTFRIVTATIAAATPQVGTIEVIAGSQVNHKYEIVVSTVSTATTLADAISAAVTADTKCPFDCINTAGALTFTAIHTGAVANGLPIGIEVKAEGVTISVALTEATPGATDPTLTGVLDVITEQYKTILWPWDDTSVLRTKLDASLNPTNEILDGVGITYATDSFSNHSSAATENNQNLVVFAAKNESEVSGTKAHYLGPDQAEAPYKKIAYFGGIRALRHTENEILSRVVSTRAPLDQLGGVGINTLPYANTVIDTLPPIKGGRGWTKTEITLLRDLGRSVMGVNPTNTIGLVGEVVTTYLTDDQSNPDPTFKFLNYVDASRAFRAYNMLNLRAAHPQSRLTDGPAVPGRSTATEASLESQIDGFYLDTTTSDFMLTRGSKDAQKFFKANRSVDVDFVTGIATMSARVPIQTQLRGIFYTMNITFNI